MDRVSDMLHLYTLSINQLINRLRRCRGHRMETGKAEKQRKTSEFLVFQWSERDVKFWKGDGEGRLVVD